MHQNLAFNKTEIAGEEDIEIKENAYLPGVVRSIFPNGVYVDIFEGISGFIDSSNPDLAKDWHKINPSYCKDGRVDFSKLLSIGDSVMIKVVNCDDLENMLLKLVYAPDTMEERKIYKHTEMAKYQDEYAKESAIIGHYRRIDKALLIDDEEDTVDDLRNSLERLGIEVDFAENLEDAIKLIRNVKEKKYKAAFVDLFLDDEKGVDACNRLSQEDPGLKFVIISYQPQQYIDRLLKEKENECIDIGILGGFEKCLGSSKIQVYLDELARFDFKDKKSEQYEEEELEKGWVFHSEKDLAKVIEGILIEAKSITSINAAAVFALNPIDLSMIEKYVIPRQYFEEEPCEGKYYFKYSPIENVTVEKDTEYINGFRVLISNRHFKHLLPFTRYKLKYFCGIPLSLGEGDEDDKYGVFFFRDEDKQFSREEINNFKLFASKIELILRKYRLENLMVKNHYILNLGILDASLIHEIKNALNYKSTKIRDLLEAIENKKMNYLNENYEDLRKLGKSFRTSQDVVDFYSEGLKGRSSRKGNLDEVISNIHNSIGSSLLNWNVSIERIIEEGTPDIIKVPITEIAQIIINLIINAVEQMNEYNTPENSRKIKIITKYKREDSLPVKIEVKDYGPGIRRKHINRIFQMGFSTKKEGTGMGLYIISSLIRLLGGEISVESMRFFETSFLIELPYRK